MKTRLNPRYVGTTLESEGEYKGVPAEIINAAYLEMRAWFEGNGGYPFGYRLSNWKETLTLSTQVWLIRVNAYYQKELPIWLFMLPEKWHKAPPRGMDQKDREAFGAFLRSLREGVRLSRPQVHTLTGISLPYLAQIERGQRNPPAKEWLANLAACYGVEAEGLYQAAGYDQEEEDD